jgi:hypothetical protein
MRIEIGFPLRSEERSGTPRIARAPIFGASSRSTNVGVGERTKMLKFSSKAISEHAEVPLADEGRLEKLVLHWS